MKQNNSLPVAIVGGGPAGLAAAAHLTVRHIPFACKQNDKKWKHST